MRCAAQLTISCSSVYSVSDGQHLFAYDCMPMQTKSAQMRYTKGSNKLLLCEAVLGNSWSVAQSMPFLTPIIVHAKVRLPQDK